MDMDMNMDMDREEYCGLGNFKTVELVEGEHGPGRAQARERMGQGGAAGRKWCIR